MNYPLICSLGIALTCSSYAQEPGKKPNTPKQPWSDYVVHDGTRPTPQKVQTNGAITTPAPADAIVLFNGTDASAFTKQWKVKDGILIASPGNTHTKQHFADCQLHIEWRVPANRKIKNQAGGNSGIFLMDKYEIQVQESHTNVTYADGQAGALYGQTPPLVNASSPQGEWQSYDILFTAPRYQDGKLISPAYVTVIHNGVVIHNHQKFYGPTVFRKLAKYPEKHPEKAPIRLQWHSDPIEFRNIWIRPL
ncbi:3-keto-disaccharide hydrolase [Rubritalea tangerina]|uniref:DUF1080 domain-containing protein n=1 Tax=Rubritalea tangerina TaxID=430798 RepID=A0ABW4ZDW8_9BACT